MIFRTALGLAAVTAIAVLVAAPDTADAKKKAKAPPKCQSRVEGTGVGQGIAGVGSQKARIGAKADWEARAHNRFGNDYASLDKAQSVTWRCRSGALEAKCVLVAKPCR